MIKQFISIKKIILILVLILIIGIYNNDKIMIDSVDKINSSTNNIFYLKGFRNKLFKTVDAINPFKGSLALNQYDLKEFNIKLTTKTLNHMDNVLEREKNNLNKYYHNWQLIAPGDNNFKKIKLEYLGEKYKAKIKFHGASIIHHFGDKKSFYVKVSKKNLLENMRRFALIITDQQIISNIFSYKFQEYFTGFKVNSELVKVSFNGISQGIFGLEEKLAKELLEKNNMSGYDFLQPEDFITSQYMGSHQEPYDYEISFTEHKNFSKKDLMQLQRYKKLHDLNKYDDIVKLINIDKFARFDAMRTLFGDTHRISGDQLKLLYNTSSGKFSPYFRTEGLMRRLKYSDFAYNFDYDITMDNDPKSKPKNNYNKLFKILIKNNEYRTLRNNYLNDIVKSKKDILNIFKKVYDKNIPILLADTTSNRPGRFNKYYNTDKNYLNLKVNFSMIEKYLKYNRVFTDLIQKNNFTYNLTIKPDSNSPLIITNIDLNITTGNENLTILDSKNLENNINTKNINKYFAKYKFMLNLDDNLQLDKSEYKFVISSNKKLHINNFKIEYKNIITNKKVNINDNQYIFNNITHPFSFDYMDMTIKEFLSEHDSFKFNVTKKDIVLKKGNYTLQKNMILPYGYNLSIEAGTNIKIASKKSILVYGGINIEGTKKNNVLISNLEKNKPFGVVAAIGDNYTFCNIKYLEIYGGKDASLNGSYLSGGLSLYSHKKVIIKNSYIHHNSADDGLNIKNSNIELKNNIFNANLADQVDLDFSNGIVTNNKFISRSIIEDFNSVTIPEDDNGDGLDLSGSKIVVQNNYYEGFLDKGISVGENTKTLIVDNFFKDNRSAITAKDQSDVYLYNNEYKNNKLNLEMYQKKQIFQHPSVYNINEVYNNKKVKKTIKSHYYKSNSEVKIIEDINLTTIFDKLSQHKWVESE